MFPFLTDLIKRLARAPGFEPGIADPKSAALPLGHARKSCERDWKGWGIPISDLVPSPLLSRIARIYGTRNGPLCQQSLSEVFACGSQKRDSHAFVGAFQLQLPRLADLCQSVDDLLRP